MEKETQILNSFFIATRPNLANGKVNNIIYKYYSIKAFVVLETDFCFFRNVFFLNKANFIKKFKHKLILTSYFFIF